MGRVSWIIQTDPVSSLGSFYLKGRVRQGQSDAVGERLYLPFGASRRAGAVSHGMGAASLQKPGESRRRLFPRASRRNTAQPAPSLQPVRVVSDSWPPELPDNKFVLLCYSSKKTNTLCQRSVHFRE